MFRQDSTELTELTELKVAEADYDLAGVVIGCAMRVHRVLGPGFLEAVYKKALQHELLKLGHRAELEQSIAVLYDGILVGGYLADLIVDDELIVEIKAIQVLAKVHEAQLVNYLSATTKDVGLLLNFGAPSLEFKKKFRRANQAPDLLK
jgi:GxxExxY protein